MLNVNVKFEKNVVSPKHKKGAFMLGLTGIRKIEKNISARKPLNLSLSMDISGSMDESLMGGYNQNSFFNNRQAFQSVLGGLVVEQVRVNNSTKLELAKKLAIEIVSSMKSGDVFSLITFDNTVSVEQEAVIINDINKREIISKINLINSRGSTDVYAGWETSAREVAKFVNDKFLNRVIMLTDGKTNHGIKDTKTIAERVASMTKANIQTTTVGIGKGFQEDLLSAMAEQGEGNFFFASKEEDFKEIFEIEFGGFNNTVLSNVELSFDLNKGVKIEQLNKLKEENGVIKLPNILMNKENKVMFSFEIDKISDKGKNKKLGVITISALDNEGKNVKYSEDISLGLVSDSVFESTPSNGDITVEVALIKTAIEQQTASDLLMAGRTLEARTLMAASASYLTENFASNAKATQVVGAINASMVADDNVMSKTLRSASYTTRYDNKK